MRTKPREKIPSFIKKTLTIPMKWKKRSNVHTLEDSTHLLSMNSRWGLYLAWLNIISYFVCKKYIIYLWLWINWYLLCYRGLGLMWSLSTLSLSCFVSSSSFTRSLYSTKYPSPSFFQVVHRTRPLWTPLHHWTPPLGHHCSTSISPPQSTLQNQGPIPTLAQISHSNLHQLTSES